MKLKIEVVALIAGLIGSGFLLALVSWWDLLPAGFRELFRGGSAGGLVLGIFTAGGLLGFFLMLFNLLTGERKLWWLRLSGYAVFLLIAISTSSML